MPDPCEGASFQLTASALAGCWQRPALPGQAAGPIVDTSFLFKPVDSYLFCRLLDEYLARYQQQLTLS
jgi:hypothetical protein